MKLASEILTAPGATPSASVAFLPGILGRGSNLRSQARRLVTAFPKWSAVLLDVRAHGKSLERDGRADTMEVAADDVIETFAGLGRTLRAVVGHSLGGKIALLAGAQVPGAQVVSLDSRPGTRPGPSPTGQIPLVLKFLDSERGPWPTRGDFVKRVVAAIPGADEAFGQWLASNLEPRDGQFHFRLDLQRIHALFQSFLDTDAWPRVEQLGAAAHLVVARRSGEYSDADIARARNLAASGGASFDMLDTGHWIHADDPDGVAAILARYLGSEI